MNIVKRAANSFVKGLTEKPPVDAKQSKAMRGNVICTSCGHVGFARSSTRGSIFIELILWLCFIIPGLIYSMWRQTSKYKTCESCRQPTVIPITSPMARKLIREMGLQAVD